MKKIMILVPFEETEKKRLVDAAPGYDLIFKFDAGQLNEVSAIIGNPPAGDLARLKKLEWVQLSTAGTEPYSRPSVLPAGCVLTNCSGAYGLAISEHMVACVAMLYKKLHLYRDNQNNALWLDRGSVRRIEGTRTLVVGMGDIGGQFARRMKALGGYIVGIKRTDSPKPAYVDELYTSEKLDCLLPDADIVALTLPGTAETANIMSRERIFAMKNDSVLLNIGRGSAVDTMALYDALRSGNLYAAALDVTDPEPLPADHPLWQCKNALITPHISGHFHLRDTYENIADICVNNLRRYHTEDLENLENIVDFATGYRKSV